MKIKLEIAVNKTLEDSFLEHLRSMVVGLMAQDQKEVEKLIEHCERTKTEEWNEEAKQELALFLMFRAGFQSASGYVAEEFEK